MHDVYFRPHIASEEGGHNTEIPDQATSRLTRIIEELGGALVPTAADTYQSRTWDWRKGLELKIGSASLVVIDATGTNMLTHAELAIAQALDKPAFVLYASGRRPELQRLIDHFSSANSHTPVHFAPYETDPAEIAEELAAFMGEVATKTVPVVSTPL